MWSSSRNSTETISKRKLFKELVLVHPDTKQDHQCRSRSAFTPNRTTCVCPGPPWHQTGPQESQRENRHFYFKRWKINTIRVVLVVMAVFGAVGGCHGNGCCGHSVGSGCEDDLWQELPQVERHRLHWVCWGQFSSSGHRADGAKAAGSPHHRTGLTGTHKHTHININKHTHIYT